MKLGIDVLEQPTWGLDCYTRRNIQDGRVLLSARTYNQLSRLFLAVGLTENPFYLSQLDAFHNAKAFLHRDAIVSKIFQRSIRLK